MLRETALNLSQSQKVRKTNLDLVVTENDICKQIPMAGRVFAVEMAHIKDKAVVDQKKKFIRRMLL